MADGKPRGAARADKRGLTERIRGFFATEGEGMERQDRHTWRRVITAVVAAIIIGILSALGAGVAFASVASDPTQVDPWITSDKDDYPPGALVTLTGGNWEPGESVHIFVDDDQTKTWTRNVHVTADEHGNISDSFNLPDWFVATYAVEATAPSGSAFASFTDGNIALDMADSDSQIASAAQSSIGWSVKWDFFSGNRTTPNRTCSGTGSENTTTYTGDDADSVKNVTNTQPAANENQSVKLKTVTVNDIRYLFDYWSTDGTVAGKITDTCIAGGNGALGPYYAHFKLAQAATAVSAISGSGTYGGTASLTATLKSGTTNLSGKIVSFKLNNVAVCGAAPLATCPTTNSDGVATLSGVGLTGIDAGTHAGAVAAAFAGDSAYSASSSTGSLTVNKASQTITVTEEAPASKVYGGSFTVAATGGGSNNAVTYSSAGSCSNTGATFTMTSGSGDCTVKFNQAGNTNYNAATEVTDTVAATKAALTITASSPTVTYGDAKPAITASYSDFVSGDGATDLTTAPSCDTAYTSSSNAGTTPATWCADAASGDYSFTYVDGSVTINKASQTITFSPPARKTYGDADFAVSATGGGSGNPVSISVNPDSGSECTISENSVSITGAGSCVLVATQSGGDNHNAADDVERTITINKASQTIIFGALSNRNMGGAAFDVSASGGGSGNAVTFSATTGSACSVTGTQVTLTGVGTCTIVASQAGNDDYHAAANVQQSFSITYGRDGGIRQPINPDNNSLFSRGKSVPVKFGLANDAPTGFSTSRWSIKRVQVSCPGVSVVSESAEQEALSSSSAGWRYDADGDQYIFNMSFSDVSAGTCWKARVNFNDGSAVLDSAIFKIGK